MKFQGLKGKWGHSAEYVAPKDVEAILYTYCLRRFCCCQYELVFSLKPRLRSTNTMPTSRLCGMSVADVSAFGFGSMSGLDRQMKVGLRAALFLGVEVNLNAYELIAGVSEHLVKSQTHEKV